MIRYCHVYFNSLTKEKSHYTAKYWVADEKGFPLMFKVPKRQRLSLLKPKKVSQTKTIIEIVELSYIFYLGNLMEDIEDIKEKTIAELHEIYSNFSINNK